MDAKRVEQLCKVVRDYRRHQFHLRSGVPYLVDVGRACMDVDLSEMWKLTQSVPGNPGK